MIDHLPARLRLGALALVCSLVLSSAASAHAHLVSAVPAAGSTLAASPPQLRLKFTEELELKFSSVKLTGPGGAVTTGDPSLDPADAALLVVPLGSPLAPGRYTVDWHATATDTHKTQGHYGFTIKP